MMPDDTTIALGALLVAALSAIGTIWVGRRQLTMQGELTRLQVKQLKAVQASQATARLVCKYHKHAGRLYLSNAGGGAARDVHFELKCPNGSSVIPSDDAAILDPLAILAPGEEISVMAHFAMGCYPPMNANARWTDPDGTEREEQILVTEA